MTNLQTTSFTDEELAKERFDELLEDGNDSDEMKEFIEEHGHKDFALYYDCLLYTSPSPRDGLLSRMPSSA